MRCTDSRLMRPFSGTWMETYIIDVTACSTAPSPPVFKDDTAYSCVNCVDCESCISPEQENDGVPQNTSCLQNMVDALLITNNTDAAPDYSQSSEHALLTYIHNYPVTLPDVETLIINLSRNFNIMSSVATNIGFFRARGCISSDDLEQMLTYIFTHDDAQNSLFQLATAQVEYFRRERAQLMLSRLTSKQKHQRQQHDDLLHHQHVNKATRKAQHRRQTFPAPYRKKSSPNFLPNGCASIADIYIELYGMSYDQVQRIILVAAAAAAAGYEKPPRRRKKVRKALLVQKEKVFVKQVRVDSFWTKTRLHNGPGLEDRGRAKVKLPERQRDGRGLVMMSPEFVLQDEEVGPGVAVESRVVSNHLFLKSEGDEVVVCVPLR